MKLLISFLSDDAWLEVPGTVYSCEGGTARLPWQYNETMYGNITFSEVTKVVDDFRFPVIIEEGTEAYLNAGITLLDVIPRDSGTYESSVYFTSGKEIHSEATLVVYSEDG